ncbi:MAG: hypothetical protein C4542_05515 [Dehalococcoidia bacterium]|nr:MAG: hypothetical protein C4542_05515 [Dehalococcoidia bacterium]
MQRGIIRRRKGEVFRRRSRFRLFFIQDKKEEVVLLQKDELDFYIRHGVVNEVAGEIIDMMARKNMILQEALEVIKRIEYQLKFIKVSMPED